MGQKRLTFWIEQIFPCNIIEKAKAWHWKHVMCSTVAKCWTPYPHAIDRYITETEKYNIFITA